MPGAPLPADEADRLAALHALGVLDSPPEERFDRVTRLAQRIFNVPVALVSLVDQDRQWFKSNQGLDVAETPRELAFCAYTILDRDVLQVRDAREDPRFADNDLVTGDTNVRFYAGCPITTPDGYQVGTLCVIDREPRELPDLDVETLRDLAGMIEEELAAIYLAISDELTGLANQRGFRMLAAHVLRVAERIKMGATLVFLDLDNMKPINDEHGHAAGDQALRDVAGLLAASFRGSDVIARVGGDEFAVLFTGPKAVDTPRALARLREAVEEHNRTEDRPYELSLSLGEAPFDPESPVSLEELTAQADAKMYEEKQRKHVEKE